MLRAQRRLLEPEGRLAFVTIEIDAAVDARQRRRATDAGPPAVGTRSTYPSMLGSSGFVDVDVIDLSDDYRTTVAAWLTERERRAERYAEQVGQDRLAEKRTSGERTLRAIDAGLLRRRLYVARRAPA